MTKKLKVWGTVAGVLLVFGLVQGISPRHIDTYDYTDVSCGTPFFPASSPSGDTRDPWGDVLGYNPATEARILSSLCWDDMDEERYVAMFMVAIGGLALLAVGWAARGTRSQPDSRESYWRQQGWVPADEVHGPPPGWQRIDGPDQKDT